MAGWADYLLSAVRYDEDRRITGARQHADDGAQIGSGSTVDRRTIADNIRKGSTYATVFAGSGGTWRLGEPVRLHRSGGDYSIRIDSNRVMFDNLGMLPGLEEQGGGGGQPP